MIKRNGNSITVTDRFGDSMTMHDCKDGSLLVDAGFDDVAFLPEDVTALQDFLNDVIAWRSQER